MAQEGVSPFSIAADWNHLYVDGERVPAGDRDTIPVENPATGEQVAEVPDGTAADVDRAYEAAVAAQPEWAATPPQERAAVVQEVMGLLEQHGDELTEVLVKEGGATHAKAHIELDVITPGQLGEAASMPMRSKGIHAGSTIPGRENLVKREPAGVVAVITPWNFPTNLTLRAVAPAVALGNAVVLKPAEQTPIMAGLMHARLFEEAGLPPGVLNVVPGYGRPAGEAVASHPDADVVAFTGSTEVGREVAANAARNLARPAMELGGNNPYVVLDDANLDDALSAGAFASFIHQGQVCISINRHVVHDAVYDDYVEGLAAKAETLVVGDPSEGEVHVGPVISDEQRDKMTEFLERSVEEGARVVTGGGHDGRFVEPTVLADVTNDMALACNEHFGPIAPVIRVHDDEEAVAVANDTEYGLSAAIQTADLGRARRMADRLEAGMVHINDQPINDEPHIPFGGVKASGLGRFNSDAIADTFTQQRWVSIQHEPREYPY